MRNEELLQMLSCMGSQGRAERESGEHLRKSFYAVPEQIRALDPDVTLILGNRGAGKTSLFRAISEFDLIESFKQQYPKSRIPDNALWVSVKMDWVPVDLVGKSVPPQEQLVSFFENQNLNDMEAFAFWESILVRNLWEYMDAQGQKDCKAVHDASGSTVSDLLSAFNTIQLLSSAALDRLDDRLEKEGKALFIGYDDLDLLVRNTGKGVSSLMGFWATRSRRWKGIRAKLFMRTDLYTRFGFGGGPDLAKIAANQITLKWSDQSLLGMLVKRILNSGDIQLIKKSFHISANELIGNDDTGWSLKHETPDKLSEIITILLGVYMGAGPKKGATQRWIINHIKDCKDNAVPRFLVRLIESAAQKQLQSRNDFTTIISPIFIREALSEISIEHVKASEPEWPWLPGLIQKISRIPQVQIIPFEKKVFENEIKKSWNESWGQNNIPPPCEDYRDFLPLLAEFGIMRERFDGRYETTDLYLDGLGFKRKGGVKRR